VRGEDRIVTLVVCITDTSLVVVHGDGLLGQDVNDLLRGFGKDPAATEIGGEVERPTFVRRNWQVEGRGSRRDQG
jgi:hypothetical protein